MKRQDYEQRRHDDDDDEDGGEHTRTHTGRVSALDFGTVRDK